MHLMLRTARLALLALIAVPASLHAEIYMKFESPSITGLDIVGDVATPGFRDYLELNSCQFGVAQNVTTTSRGPQVGKPTLSEISVTKAGDKTSPKLFEATIRGARYGKVTISYTVEFEGEAVVYYKIELKDVFVTGWNTSSGGDIPEESLSLVYSSIRQTFTPMNGPSTPVVSEWNVVTGRPEFRLKEESVTTPVIPGDKPASTGTEITVEE